MRFCLAVQGRPNHGSRVHVGRDQAPALVAGGIILAAV